MELTPPYEDLLGSPSYEVCPNCGFEFGNDDNPGTAAPSSFEDYRAEWARSGSPRFDAGLSEKRALRSARRAQQVIRSLLLEWDAIGAGVPDDEYDCMIWPLYKLIRQRSSDREIAALVADYRRDHFGLEYDGEADTKLAVRLVAAFTDQ